MKKAFVTAIIVLLTMSVKAQTGMPKELTCTEEAFNFSFSLGSKWKLYTPKMGPVGILRNDPDYIPSRYLKVSGVAPEKHLLPLLQVVPGAFNYANSGQNYVPLFYPDSLKMMDMPVYPVNGVNFSSPLNYMVLKPAFLVNSNQQIKSFPQ